MKVKQQQKTNTEAETESRGEKPVILGVFDSCGSESLVMLGWRW